MTRPRAEEMTPPEVITKKQRKRKLIALLYETIYARRVWQERPNTFVKFRVKVPPSGKENFETFGFSKVCQPDEWDDEYGIELAEKKAMARAARIVMAKWG
jgi:hypothetical protein